MTNKTREKLREKLNFSFDEGYEQGRLAILRKWKKAMEKSLTSEWVVDYLSKRIMNSEYLKAKKEIEG